jgi:hypothetical protein
MAMGGRRASGYALLTGGWRRIKATNHNMEAPQLPLSCRQPGWRALSCQAVTLAAERGKWPTLRRAEGVLHIDPLQPLTAMM